MNDPALKELHNALTSYCDEVLNDTMVSTTFGPARQLHWQFRGQEFRVTLTLHAGNISPLHYLQWRRSGSRWEQLPSHPLFEVRRTDGVWVALPINHWRRLLRTAGRRRPNDDSEPGTLTGLPVRPTPGLPSLRAGAAATLPEPDWTESATFYPAQHIHHHDKVVG